MYINADWNNPYNVKVSPMPSSLIIRTNRVFDRHGNTLVFVAVRDGEREACFLPKEGEKITTDTFSSGTNKSGIRCFAARPGINDIYIDKRVKNLEAEVLDMINFVKSLEGYTVEYAPNGYKTYLV